LKKQLRVGEDDFCPKGGRRRNALRLPTDDNDARDGKRAAKANFKGQNPHNQKRLCGFSGSRSGDTELF